MTKQDKKIEELKTSLILILNIFDVRMYDLLAFEEQEAISSALEQLKEDSTEGID